MKYWKKKQKEKKVCDTCLGCNKLEIEGFRGVTDCKSHIEDKTGEEQKKVEINWTYRR